MTRSIVLALVLAAVPAAAFATQEPQLALAEGDFAAQRAGIERDLADGTTYAEIRSSDRARVRESLQRIAARLQGVDSIDALPDTAKVEVLNDQEIVNTILTRAKADSRLVCERSRPTGSHRPSNRCQTVAERQRRREEDRSRLQGQQNSIRRVDADSP